MSDTTYSGPYARAAQIYRAAGWHGVLPLGSRPGRKYPPPHGWTGHGAPMPSAADVAAWQETHGDRNIGLRLPPGVLGLDVDAYPGKRGGETLAALVAKFGELPPTWITTARTDGVSGIRLFRVPTHLTSRSWYNDQGSWSWDCPCGERSTANLPRHVADDAAAGHAAHAREINWPGEAGTHIEIIQTGHRYAVVWPSTNPEADGAQYGWLHADREELEAGALPRVDDLAALPDAWVRGLALAYDRTEKVDLNQGAMSAWWRSLRPGPACRVVETVLAKALADLRAVDGSRHESARDAAAALARFGGEGHRGVIGALQELAAGFEQAVGVERVKNGEYDRLLAGAVKLAARDNAQPRQHCEHDAATPVVLPPELMASFMPPAPEPTFAAPPSPGAAETSDAGVLTLPEEFWAARESLGKVRQAAHSRVRSGDVVLHGLLVRLAAMAPHTLRADTGIGTPASLNLFSAIVGPSGAGKSSGLAVSRDLVKTERPLEEFPLGSGEGIAESYMGDVMAGTGQMKADGSEKQERVRKQVRHNVLFHSDEGNTLVKLIERSGSTVGETLRSAWSGESIGQKNGRAETTRTIPAREYAAGLVIGFQPTTVLPLLGDVDAGTPQRFLYAWAVDPAIPGREQRVPWPGEMASPFPADVPTDLPAAGTIVSAPPPRSGDPITFAPEIVDELYDIEHAKASGSLPADHLLRDPFRSQHTVLKVKIGALLALLEGRRRVDASDWQLAQVVIDTSDRVREHLQALARAAAGKARAAQLAAEAETEAHRAHARASVSASLDQSAERRVAMRVAAWVHDGEPMTLGALRKRATSGDRKHVDAAVQLGIELGWLAPGDDAKVHAGPSRPGGVA